MIGLLVLVIDASIIGLVLWWFLSPLLRRGVKQ
jgi:hypothetical protein